jgi:N-sulfoglucosamine sulfohydrolase
LLLLTDDQSAHLSCLGTRGIQTPHVDALAQAGVLFQRAYATCASCSPARSAILTGIMPHANGHWRNTHAPGIPGEDEDFGRNSRFARIESVGVHEDVPTLVEVLNDAGYVTGITEKFHLSPPWKYPFAHRLAANFRPETHFQATESFLQACEDKPFFLMANIGNTHRPFARHTRGIPVPRVDPNAIDVPANLPDTALLRRDLAQYLTAVQCADACVGQILQALRNAGRYERTLIIFTSDQGYCYHRAKATAYDMGLHVPLIVSGPGVDSGRVNRALVSHVDLWPTILDVLSLPEDASLPGQSLRPWLTGQADVTWRSTVFAEHNAHGPGDHEFYPIRSAFDGRYHYLKNLRSEKNWTGDPAELLSNPQRVRDVAFAGPADAFPGGSWDNHSYEATVRARERFPRQYDLLAATFKRPREELYDLDTDPYEMVNLSDDPNVLPQLERLRRQVETWMSATRDPGGGLRYMPRRSD